MFSKKSMHKIWPFLIVSVLCIWLVVRSELNPKTAGLPTASPSRVDLPDLSNFDLSDFSRLNLENTIPLPCIEPHCTIECSVLYPISSTNQSKDIDEMTWQQQQHLTIDLGEDELVNRLIAENPKPKICSVPPTKDRVSENDERSQVEYYPLSFGFNEHFLLNTIPRKVLVHKKERVVMQTCIPKKTKDFSSLLPGKFETYQFEFGHELDYRRLYSASYFAVTMKKGGWDCNRHYEIISAGAMPYFDELERTNDFTMKHLPKALLIDAKSIHGINRNNLTLNHEHFNFTQYQLLLHRLLYYAKHRLTTRKLVEYILRTINYRYQDRLTNHSVLFIAHNHCDYMKEFMLHGFTLVFEDKLHIYQPPPYLYGYSSKKMWSSKETEDYYGGHLYGFGYGFALSLTKYAHLFRRDVSELASDTIVKEEIKRRKYTLIVFGSVTRRNSLLSFATKYYKKSEIVLIDGEDERKVKNRSEFAKVGTYFLREIPDNCDLLF